MLIREDPDGWVPVGEIQTCDFHRKNPGVPYAGCMCGGSYGRRRATPEEREELRRKRLEQEREELRRRLAAIDAELGR